jgi:hypothetical protein
LPHTQKTLYTWLCSIRRVSHTCTTDAPIRLCRPVQHLRQAAHAVVPISPAGPQHHGNLRVLPKACCSSVPQERDGVTASLWNVTLLSLVTSNTVLLPPLQCIPGRFYPARFHNTQRNFRVKVKVKQSLYRSGQALRVPGG